MAIQKGDTVSELEYYKEEAFKWRAKFEEMESRKSHYLLLTFLFGLLLLVQAILWLSTPQTSDRVNASAPVYIHAYNFWNDRHITRYMWGKNDDGVSCWITVDEKEKPTGGFLPVEND